MSKLSIVVVNYNSGDMLLDCLYGIRRNKTGFPLEIIVVDNGSSDNSLIRAKDIFQEIICIVNQTNVGYAKAVNMGIRYASGEYLFVLNTDVILGGNVIKPMIEFLEKNQDIGILSPQLVHKDGRLQNTFYAFPSIGSIFVSRSMARRKYFKKPGYFLVDGVVGASMMIRRKALQEVGLFDENFFFFLEETDLCKRMVDSGWKVALLPSIKVVHLQGRTASKNFVGARIEYCRSLYIYVKKYSSSPAYVGMRMLYPFKLFLDLVVNSVGLFLVAFRSVTLKRRCKVYLKLCWWHLLGCPDDMGLRIKHL